MKKYNKIQVLATKPEKNRITFNVSLGHALSCLTSWQKATAIPAMAPQRLASIKLLALHASWHERKQ